MAKKTSKNDALLAETDALVRDLLKRATSSRSSPAHVQVGGAADLTEKPPLASIDEQIDVLAAITKYLATKHKIKPDEDEPSDFLSRARRELPPGASGPAAEPRARPAPQRRARRQTAPNPAAPASGVEPASGTDESPGLQFGRAGMGPALALPADAPVSTADLNGATSPAQAETRPEAS